MGLASHASPSVLLREHNLLAKLPEGTSPEVKEMFRRLRGQEGSQALISRAVPGVRLHEGKRYSRHAIRRIEEASAGKFKGIKERGQKAITSGYGKAMQGAPAPRKYKKMHRKAEIEGLLSGDTQRSLRQLMAGPPGFAEQMVEMMAKNPGFPHVKPGMTVADVRDVIRKMDIQADALRALYGR